MCGSWYFLSICPPGPLPLTPCTSHTPCDSYALAFSYLLSTCTLVLFILFIPLLPPFFHIPCTPHSPYSHHHQYPLLSSSLPIWCPFHSSFVICILSTEDISAFHFLPMLFRSTYYKRAKGSALLYPNSPGYPA